jgi:SAM-dependent methyltransferase
MITVGQEIDLLVNYPRTLRDLKERGALKTEEDRAIAREFGREFFDGERRYGYGGFHYNARFWQPTIPDFQDHFGLKAGDKILDVGCAKGFMLYDFTQVIPGVEVAGIDISSYAIENVLEDMKPFVQVGDARDLPFENDSFDLVISINTIHNLERSDLSRALREIERVSRGKSFITVDAYRNEAEREAMEAWNLTAKTFMHVDDWKVFFQQVGYTGDYYWFIP